MIIIVVSSQPLAQNLDYGCAGRVGNLTISSLHCARLLDLEPDKELSDQISLATLTCVELPGILQQTEIDGSCQTKVSVPVH